MAAEAMLPEEVTKLVIVWDLLRGASRPTCVAPATCEDSRPPLVLVLAFYATLLSLRKCWKAWTTALRPQGGPDAVSRRIRYPPPFALRSDGEAPVPVVSVSAPRSSRSVPTATHPDGQRARVERWCARVDRDR